jgi:hypothetical protein
MQDMQQALSVCPDADTTVGTALLSPFFHALLCAIPAYRADHLVESMQEDEQAVATSDSEVKKGSAGSMEASIEGSVEGSVEEVLLFTTRFLEEKNHACPCGKACGEEGLGGKQRHVPCVHHALCTFCRAPCVVEVCPLSCLSCLLPLLSPAFTS